MYSGNPRSLKPKPCNNAIPVLNKQWVRLLHCICIMLIHLYSVAHFVLSSSTALIVLAIHGFEMVAEARTHPSRNANPVQLATVHRKTPAIKFVILIQLV